MDYKKGHVENAVNVSRADIVVNTPFPNMLCPPGQLEEIMVKRGVSNSSAILVYDTNKNMDSARFWWTLKIYGHDDVKVVSGGMDALVKAGVAVSTVDSNLSSGVFKASSLRSEMLALKKEINLKTMYQVLNYY